MKIYNEIYIKLCTISFFFSYSSIIKAITNTMKHNNHIFFHKTKRRKKYYSVNKISFGSSFIYINVYHNSVSFQDNIIY